MNGPQHYKEAERLLEQSSMRPEGDLDIANSEIAEAQVHATLALTAATANQDCKCGLVEAHDVTCPSREWTEATR